MLTIYHFPQDEAALREQLNRTVSFDPDAQRTVDDILYRVRTEGDAAVLDYTERFQGIRLYDMRVPEAEIEAAYAAADPEFIAILEEAFANITAFHRNEAEKSFFYEQKGGVILGQRVTPMEKALLYVPGGKAAYPSSVLMNAAPAQVAGVDEISMTTPCDAEGKVNPHILAAAKVAGITSVYRLGGAQAVAAFAYGTATIPKVDIVTGPGNKYVALAKKQVFGHVAIDSIAGPSEVVVIADAGAEPEFIVMDMFAQAEHDPDASAVLITPSAELADAVRETAARLAGTMLRGEVITRALTDNGAIVVTGSMQEACKVSDMIAPEHLELHVDNPWEILPDLRHAGAIFMGQWSCETVGDYFAGPNHTLPTNGTARFFSPLSVRDFVKHTSIIAWSKSELARTGEKIARFADHEGLQAHAEAVRVRLKHL
ncbi:MAG TPA: histidinol dehydrogenase [Chlorobaculum sp.]|uniref:Histidinol dehydrogenase n=1 Tax=Chlorobaculum tepidum (strain ATCC 49652 / DSM 12025 / NBRC 103806 / TLS) TaxID=194439 RepID=HISX_CHLTE|nr:histidinol dehydrogenase [Chlorobaculum tepidum]Q8KEY6.1 RecName: Full=Histidinol dehydrogenase; Short=HDH [Chlorobaculum tepidum TLS]AAM71788.1 histidinol dehydrogenase [Chlorobaculum tepidum TLS]HBU24026.1 histidinol dehydrogenase [Chlorobaculum sp.]